MFDWALFFVLILACLPGILVSLPRLIQQMEGLAASRLPEGQQLPSRAVLLAATTVQTLLLVAIFAAIGTALAPRVGLEAPFFAGLAAGVFSWTAVQAQLLPALLYGIGGAIVFVAVYYLVMRPRLDEQNLHVSERLRNELGIAARVLYGGVVEEVLTRWGLMTLFVWLGALLVGEPTPLVMWSAIVISGILFGLGHLPSYLAAGCRATPMLITFMLVLNLWASLVFGWLFWQVGLLAAMFGHMLFHLVWWPFDRRYYRPETAVRPEPLLQ